MMLPALTRRWTASPCPRNHVLVACERLSDSQRKCLCLFPSVLENSLADIDILEVAGMEQISIAQTTRPTSPIPRQEPSRQADLARQPTP